MTFYQNQKLLCRKISRLRQFDAYLTPKVAPTSQEMSSPQGWGGSVHRARRAVVSLIRGRFHRRIVSFSRVFLGRCLAGLLFGLGRIHVDVGFGIVKQDVGRAFALGVGNDEYRQAVAHLHECQFLHHIGHSRLTAFRHRCDAVDRADDDGFDSVFVGRSDSLKYNLREVALVLFIIQSRFGNKC